MKGGVTSGIVYPLAIVELSRAFRFKNLGGTSAGAIAAAGAAAAELGRSTGNGSGFDELEQLPSLLAARTPNGKTRLFSFFQPQTGPAPLFRICAAGLGGGVRAPLRVLAAAVLVFPVTAVLGALPGTWLGWVALGQSGWMAAVTVVLAVGALVLGPTLALSLRFIQRTASALPANFYGLCSGMPGAEGAPGDALTPWLEAFYDRLAGVDARGAKPLTFGDLSGASDPIHLEMMTTCVTMARPFRLPFRDDADVREARMFYFKPEELSRLFSERVVKWLASHPRPAEGAESEARRNRFASLGLLPLPAQEDIPVVVAVRMSLSFPILLSAVPLWAVDYSLHATEAERMPEHCWFSDGGMSSNFPVHFFDSPLPRWPTFGIDLGDKHPDYPAGFWMPDENSGGILQPFHRFEEGPGLGSIFGLLSGMLNSMMSWSDTLQSQLPGYRDRVAHVRLEPADGGLNLAMPDDRIRRLTGFGRDAGIELRERFTNRSPVQLDWTNHRWIRLRNALAALEETLGAIERGCAAAGPGQGEYDAWLRSGVQPPSYAWANAAQAKAALDLLDSLLAASSSTRQASQGTPLSVDAPRPRPELRIRPRV